MDKRFEQPFKHLTPSRVDWLKQKARDSWEFVKENPNELMLGLITLAVFDIEDDIDDIPRGHC